MTTKATLREEARRRRSSFAHAIPDFAQRIAEFADEIAELRTGAVAGYLPLNDEADPRLLMDALASLDRTLALPCVEGRGRPLSFRRWSEGDELALNTHGISEPVATAPILVPDVLLVPLLAFDSQGHRLGYGGGYYDRTLDQLRRDRTITAVGVAFAGQETPQLPRASHDHVLDLIVTERGVRRFG